MYWPEGSVENQEEVFMTIENNFETILFEVKDLIGHITINRESKLNALNQQVLNELKTLLLSIGKNEDFGIRGLIITGAGEKAFIAGADIAEMSGLNQDEAKSFGKLGQEVTLLLENLNVPVIACVNGFALGGGCELAMGCDFIYSTERAIFGQPEVKLGLIPGFGGTQRLARYIGRNMAREIIYTGKNMKADEAHRLGLVTRLYSSKDELLAGAIETLKGIQKMSPLAVGVAKKVMNEANDLTVSESLTCELNGFADIFTSEDMKEGTTAFMEKREPNFTGK